jgi:5-methylcytosine-specific restriction endonuclease McrA
VSQSWHKDGRPLFIYNGLDRIDSNLGYSVANCVPCCTKCNYAKGNMTLLEFKEWLSKAYNHMFNAVEDLKNGTL